MSGERTQFRRGAEAIRAAGGLVDVHEQVEAAGLRIIGQSGAWLFHQCPNHDDHARGDRHPSAQSNVETGFWQCFACGARGRWPGYRSGAPASDNAPDVPDIGPVEPFEPAPTRETSWDYQDEDGHVVYRVMRIPSGDDPSGKSFFVRHPNEHGTWVVGKPGSGFVLYRLPELIEAVAAGETVYVAESEKDADSLAAAGVAATCNTGGANKRREWEAHAHYLAGVDVVVVVDRDRAGLRHALDVREKLSGVAASVAIRLPALGKDVSDHLHNGRGLDELEPLEAPRLEARPPGESGLAPSDGAEQRAVLEWDTEARYEPPQWLWRDWVVSGNLNVLAGDGGCGKTHFAVGMAARLSSGDIPGDHRGRPGRTLYLSAEDDFARLVGLYRGAGGEPGMLARMVIPAGDGWADDPHFPGDMDELRRLVRSTDFSLVVIDPGASFFSVRESHNDAQMREHVFRPLAQLARQSGAAVLYVAHLNKGAGTFRQRINGAVSAVNAPRSVLGMARDPEAPEDRSVLAHVKGNLTRPPSSLVFEFVETELELDGQRTRVTRLDRVGTTGLTADDLVAPAERETKGQRAVEFLRDALAGGPLPSKELSELAAANDISEGTLAAARKREGVVSRRQGKGWAVGYAHQFGD